jgi:hypothetical protein
MRFVVVTWLAAVAALCLSRPVAAHHSLAAQYDPQRPITLTGKVNRVEWTNPHARFYLDVRDPKGHVVTWNFELASPNTLHRAGWSRTSLKEGDQITVEGSIARSGENVGNARSVTLADGSRLPGRSTQEPN